jgi:integrase
MTPDILKLIGPATALAAGTHLRLSDAVESTGIKQDELLRIAADGNMPLFCRVSQVPGYVVPTEDLEFADVARGASGGYVLPSPSQMPDAAAEVVLTGILTIPVNECAAIAGAILAESLEDIDLLAFDAPNAPGSLFVPNLALRVNVGALEVRTDAVALVHRRMGAKITPEQIQRAQAVQTASVKSAATSVGKKANMRFSDALEAYATTASGIPGKVTSLAEQTQKRRGCALFIELVGDLVLGEVTADRLREFREALKSLPTKANNIPKEYRRETMAATVAALRDGGVNWDMMSEASQHERMQWVNQMFRWLVVQKKWLNENPMASVLGEQTQTAAERKAERQAKALRKAESKDDSDDREPFTPDELRLIFSQTHYKAGNGAHVEGNALWYPFEFWLPLIGLFAGCRIGEICQLRLADVRQSSDGVWYFDLNETSADKSLKNVNATRQIPISTVLIEIGLVTYRDRLLQEGYARLFPELSYSLSDARYAKEAKRKMSETFKRLGMPRNGTKVFHCLRANFNDALLRVPFTALPFDDPDLKRFIRLKIVGHKVEGVNEEHYSSTTMAEKSALVNGVSYSIPAAAKFDIDFAIEQVRAGVNNKVGFRRGREDMGPLNPA